MGKGPKNIRVEWCEDFIKAQFKKYRVAGIETTFFWKLAETAGLWERGTYGSPMSKALGTLCTVEPVFDEKGNYSYSVFKLV